MPAHASGEVLHGRAHGRGRRASLSGGKVAQQPVGAGFAAAPRPQRGLVLTGIPEVELGRRSVVSHGCPVGCRSREGGLPPGAGAGASRRRARGRRRLGEPGEHERGRQPQDVPLERPGQRLVIVVAVEDQPPVRRAEHAEVAQVRVAAQLNHEPAGRHRPEVGGHDDGRPPVEREGRGGRPGVPQRQQDGDPVRLLRAQQVDRVGPVGGGPPRGERRPRAVLSGRAAKRDPVVEGETGGRGRRGHGATVAAPASGRRPPVRQSSAAHPTRWRPSPPVCRPAGIRCSRPRHTGRSRPGPAGHPRGRATSGPCGAR